MVYDELFQRNIGVFTEQEQSIIRNSRVAIAGLGGVGGITAEALTRMGIGSLHISDPEAFEPSNCNRQAFSNVGNFGKNKTTALAEELVKINPGLDLDTWPEGINEQNANEFVDADVIINGIEYNLLEHSVILHKAAREAGKIALAGQAIGFGGTLLAFNSHGISFEEYIGLPENAAVDEIREYIVPIDKFCPTIPSYASPEIVDKVIKREMYIPSSKVGCVAASAMLVMATVLTLLKAKDLPVAPDCISIDFFDLFSNSGSIIKAV